VFTHDSAAIGIAGGRLRFVERLPELADLARQLQAAAGWEAAAGAAAAGLEAAVERAHRAHHHLERRLDLGAVGLARPELGRGDERRHHRANVAVGRAERRRHAVHERRRRLVAHEVPGQLGGDEARRGRMPHQDVDDALAIPFAPAGGNRLAEHALAAGVVRRGRNRYDPPSRGRRSSSR
jgi:hypothetical protein